MSLPYLQKLLKELPKKVSSSSSSSSEDEAKTPVVQTKAPAAISQKNTTKATPPSKLIKIPKKVSSSSSSEEEKANPPVANKTKAAAIPAKQDVPAGKKVATPKKESSSASSSTTSDEKTKIPAANPSKSDTKQPKAVTPVNGAPKKKKSSVSSESEEKVIVPKANKKKTKKSGSSSEDSSDELHIVKPPASNDVVMSEAENKGLKRKREPDDSTNKKRKVESTSNATGNLRIRVGNLSFALQGKDDEIKEQFKSCGKVTKVESITNKDGRFAGVVILDFETAEAANKALELHDQEFYDRKMCISFSNDNPRPAFKAKPTSPKPDGCNTVWIGNLSYEITEDEVYEFFADCGEVKQVRWPNGDFTGIGWVEFTDTNAPDLAIAKAGTKIRGRDIRIDYAQPRKSRF